MAQTTAYEVVEKDVPAMLVASVTEHVPLTEAGSVIPDAFRMLMEVVAPIGYGSGMPGVVYHEMDPLRPGDIEVFMPVKEGFDPPPGVSVRTFEATHAVSTMHRGPYDQVGRAYEALTTWLAEHRKEPVGPPRELYLNDPNEVGMQEALTEIDWPVG